MGIFGMVFIVVLMGVITYIIFSSFKVAETEPDMRKGITSDFEVKSKTLLYQIKTVLSSDRTIEEKERYLETIRSKVNFFSKDYKFVSEYKKLTDKYLV